MTEKDMTILTEREEALLTFYNCDHIRYLIAVETDKEADRIIRLNNNLSDKEISNAIKNYNIKTYGLSYSECKQRKCLCCKDLASCDL